MIRAPETCQGRAVITRHSRSRVMLARTRTAPVPVSYSSRNSSGLEMISPPVG